MRCIERAVKLMRLQSMYMEFSAVYMFEYVVSMTLYMVTFGATRKLRDP